MTTTATPVTPKGKNKKLQRYASASRLEKTFLWLSVSLVLAFIIIYAVQVKYALSMDPSSYNCTNDSMMMQICKHPYSSSVTWAFIYLCYFGWPFLVAWLVVSYKLWSRRRAQLSKKKSE